MRLRRSSLRWWLLTRTVATTRDKARAERSRFMWLPDGDGRYRLRVIGVLGLKVYVLNKEGE